MFLAELQALQVQAEEGERQLAMLQQVAEQTNATILTLQNLPNSKDALFQAGSGVLLRASVSDAEKVLVEMGAGVVMEKTALEAQEILKHRASQALEAANKIRGRTADLAQRIEEISAILQQMSADAQKT